MRMICRLRLTLSSLNNDSMSIFLWTILSSASEILELLTLIPPQKMKRRNAYERDDLTKQEGGFLIAQTNTVVPFFFDVHCFGLHYVITIL